MIIKYLIFALVIWILYIIFFKTSKKEKKEKKNIDGDTMVECSNCSVFVSQSEAIIKDGKFYCSKECAGV